MGTSEDNSGLQEKNKQFVGDLLFGQNSNSSGGHSAVVEVLQRHHGYQILGIALEKFSLSQVYQAWTAEVTARKNEMDLLRTLEEEENVLHNKIPKLNKIKCNLQNCTFCSNFV